MSAIVVRPWTEEDIPAVREITWETWVATYAPFVPVEDLREYYERQYSLQELTSFMRQSTTGGYVAFVDSRPAAYVRNGYSDIERRFYVMSLYVLPLYQGHGLGTRLMVASERSAAAWGVDRVWLGVMEQNTRTLQWYRKMGFEFVEEAPFVMGKTSVNHLIGFKLLSSTLTAKS
jgi:ribosomal protein S18 acetylase RimI-like enzyme